MRKLPINLAGVVCGVAVCLMSWPSLASALCVNPIAEIVSAQGDIELNKVPATLADAICPGDVIKVGPRSRAAIVILETDTVLRIDQDTELRMRSISPQGVSLLDLLQGAINLLTPAPRSLEIKTPVVNAAVEGTEFYMRVEADRAVITVFEGRVAATNDFGSLRLTANESAVVVATQAPKRQVIVRPRDAVQWALYYPPIGVGETASLSTRRAAELLAVGRVDEASGLLDDAIRKDPNEVGALALKSIIAVAQNRNEEALQLATDTVSANPDSAAAHIALSYAQQAIFRLDLARQSVEKAVELDTDNALAWARLSELWLSAGNLDKALETAGNAVDRDPDVARTQSVLGFAYLTRIEINDAQTAFENAIQRDQADPLPRLGLGLAKIRRGDLMAGRRDIEIAASLDANNSLVRSYLGKAYFEEKRNPLDGRQFAIAKALDPNDPTPWFYDAIRKQTINRPVDALHDLQKSIELNDNRAVYRSRLLLDRDLAARGASLARIYQDLGFDLLALVEGWKSVNLAPDDFSSHRFLADTYATLPRHEIARVSELLQSQLLQPINITPLQPQLAETNLFFISGAGPSLLSFNEFNPLLVRNRLAFQADLIAGEKSTFGDDLILAGISDRYSFSVGQFHFETDGFRENNDRNLDIGNAFFQSTITPKTSVQAELRTANFDRGDLAAFFDPTLFVPNFRQEDQRKSVRLGVHHEFAPHSDLIANVSYQDAEFDSFFVGEFEDLVDEDGYTAEIQHLFNTTSWNLTSGVGRSDVDSENAFVDLIFGDPPFVEKSEITHMNAYAYSQVKAREDVTITLGLSGDNFEGGIVDSDQLNPKLGLMWTPLKKTTVRAAAFRTFERTLITNQTVEPTQVAGFNQFFEDGEGTDATRYGVALDQKISSSLYAGIELSKRDRETPTLLVEPPFNVIKEDFEEELGRLYVNWAPHSQWALAAEYHYEKLDNELQLFALGDAATLKTRRLLLGARFFDPSGFNAALGASYIDQQGRFGDFSGGLVPGEDHFWIVDVALGYRLPKRFGLILLEVRNLFDEEFNFLDTDPRNPRLAPERFAFLKINLFF